MTDAEKERIRKAIKSGRMVVIGTSGSHDYLKDTTGGRRFWPIRAPSSPPTPLSPEDRAVVDKLVALTSVTVHECGRLAFGEEPWDDGQEAAKIPWPPCATSGTGAEP